MMKIQRKIERKLQEIDELLENWKCNDDDCLNIENELRIKFEQIFNQQLVLNKKMRHLKLENDKKISIYQDKIEEFFRSVFLNYKNRYPIEIEYEDLINNYKDDPKVFLVLGVSGIIQKEKLIEKIYHSEFKRKMSSHPKNDYPLARSIKRKFIIHSGPTNAGKTYESLEKLKMNETGIYLAPLRLLAVEVFEKLNMEEVPCSLKTGEEEIEVPFSTHIASTIEKADFDTCYDLAIIDEGQLIGDPIRGASWTRAVLGLFAKEIHICCSVNAVPILKKIITDCGDEVEVIKHNRNTPLIFEKENFSFPEDVKQGDALIVFTRNKALEVASILSKVNIKASVIYGNLPPGTRRKQVKQFIDGDTKVVVSTDAIGMGINLPIKRIVFLETEKFDGNSPRELIDQEVKQISGRAGRQGIYPEGYVNSFKDKEKISGQLKKKDEIISTLFIKPNKEVLLSINVGTLKEKLIYWLTYATEIPYIKKAAIDEQLILIDEVDEKLNGILSEEQLYKAIHIPFDFKNEYLLKIWNKYLTETLIKEIQYTRPDIIQDGELDELETLYRQIDLYYSFSKTFNKNVDDNWVNRQRTILSEKIHKKLIEDIDETAFRY
ncbi:helicase-related protein [Bacillus mexicanus]|uniref:helicase-related protein n=1 Tax=Bacillus mexicanus TaxID=2834415 RepID=UPI003D23377E